MVAAGLGTIVNVASGAGLSLPPFVELGLSQRP